MTPRSRCANTGQHGTLGRIPPTILQHKCPGEEGQLPLCFNTQNLKLYTFSLKYSFHGIQQKLHINTPKNPNPFCETELKLVLVQHIKPYDQTSGLDLLS